MARVLATHEIELKEGVTGDEFERFFNEKLGPTPLFPGWRLSLLTGDRGERAGKYLLLIEIESVEARDRIWPTPGQATEENDRWWQTHQALAEEWQRLASMPGASIFTDYVVIAEGTEFR